MYGSITTSRAEVGLTDCEGIDSTAVGCIGIAHCIRYLVCWGWGVGVRGWVRIGCRWVGMCIHNTLDTQHIGYTIHWIHNTLDTQHTEYTIHYKPCFHPTQPQSYYPTIYNHNHTTLLYTTTYTPSPPPNHHSPLPLVCPLPCDWVPSPPWAIQVDVCIRQNVVHSV